MKHIAQVQLEFLKEARKWNDLSLEEQKVYLRKHPKSKKKITSKSKNKKIVDMNGHELRLGDKVKGIKVYSTGVPGQKEYDTAPGKIIEIGGNGYLKDGYVKVLLSTKAKEIWPIKKIDSL
jgi:hypothetical protein